MRTFFIGLFLLASFSLHAESGADALLESMGQKAPASAAGAAGNTSAPGGFFPGAGLKLDDPFLVSLYSQWQVEKALPYEINLWVQRIFRQDFAGAAHLWSVLQPKIPASFANAATGAHLYLLWKLDVPQTFFNEWLDALSDLKYRDSTSELALDQTIAPAFDEWLYQTAPIVSPYQESIIESLDLARGSQYATLRAWTSLRKGAKGQTTLSGLVPSHPLRIALAQTVVLDMIGRGDLGGAARILKQYVEPSLELGKDPYAYAAYDLQIGRMLYQAGSLDGSETFYEKIPNGAPQYLEAREELAWVRLRKGEISKLRGELETLRSDIFNDRFAPEVYLVRAISNLKLCYYDEVEKDFAQFLERNRKWAKQIVQALNAQDPPAPNDKDFFSQLAEKSLGRREAEIARLAVLSRESIAAALPAVGAQVQWENASARVKSAAEATKKQLAAEYRRQWRNRERALSEAIRKMQFVKVELLSQLRYFSKLHQSPSKAVASEDAKNKERSKTDPLASSGERSFPFDGVVWPDELFKLRSFAMGQCLSQR